MTDLAPYEEKLRVALLEMVEAAYASGVVISVLQAPIKFCVERGDLSPIRFDLPDDRPETRAAHVKHLEETWKWIETYGNDHSFEADSPLGLAVRSLKFAPIEIEHVISCLNLREGVFASFHPIQQKVLYAREEMMIAAAECLNIPTQFDHFNSLEGRRAVALKEASDEYDPFSPFGFLAYGKVRVDRALAD